MNPPIFLGSKVNEDSQEFFKEVYKIVEAMGVTFIEKDELAGYQLKDVAQVWKSGHQLIDCPTRTGKGREDNQVHPSGSNSDAPKKNRFYSLQSRSDQEGSLDVVTGMLQVFSIDVYALLDPGGTLSFVTPLVAMKFDILTDVLEEPFSVSIPVCDSVVAKRV
uniref:Gag-pol polyprotein n=1 Tax=Solanum tuberosum TaxID=4113 RepID=M1DCG5_SOLTU